MSKVKKTRQIVINYPYNDVFAATIDAARQAGMEVELNNPSTGEIRITKSITLWSFGEVIIVNLRPLGASATEMFISSDSAVSTTLIDWGINNRNINKIIEGVNRLLYQHYNR